MRALVFVLSMVGWSAAAEAQDQPVQAHINADTDHWHGAGAV